MPDLANRPDPRLAPAWPPSEPDLAAIEGARRYLALAAKLDESERLQADIREKFYVLEMNQLRREIEEAGLRNAPPRRGQPGQA